MAIEVKVRKGEAVERRLKQLKKILDKENIIKDFREKRYHRKPSALKRLKNKELAFNDMLRHKREDM